MVQYFLFTFQKKQRSPDKTCVHKRVLRSKSNHFLVQPAGNTWERSGTSRHDGVSVQVFSDVDVALHDGFGGQDMDTFIFLSDQGRLEENFRASESLVSNGNNVSSTKETLTETKSCPGVYLQNSSAKDSPTCALTSVRDSSGFKTKFCCTLQTLH